MNDRELLQLAAKAAEYEYKPKSSAIIIGGVPATWNPLEDDGDALRLAVKLEITVSHHGATHVCETEFGGYLSDEVDTDGDGLAATRRAIVRAAAEIGRS